MRRVALVLLVAVGCRSVDNITKRAPLGVSRPSTDTAPRNITLPGQADSVLVVTLTATSAGYNVALRMQRGAHSQSVDLGRDVLITALDRSGGRVGATSIFNPRIIRTVGSKDPRQAVLATGSATVSFPRPREIASLDLQVRRGPNAGYNASISVPNGTVRVLKPGRDSL